MKVAIIGSGNVAIVLGNKIAAAGHEIVEVAGRNARKVEELASALHANGVTDVKDITKSADIYIICVADAAIKSVADQLKLDTKLIVHTAAAVSKNVLEQVSSNYGVMYPLQSLKGHDSFTGVLPILVDANTRETLQTVIQFSSTWADHVSIASDEDRLKTHIAAVFVNNFTNYLFTIVNDYCIANHFDFQLLEPLIKETVEKLGKHPPSTLQTGPAIRQDFETIRKHEKLLAKDTELSQLYTLFTNGILEYYHSKTP